MPLSSIVIESFESECLKNNPLGDPHIRKVPIYLPPGYESSRKRFPVIYVLTGFTGSGLMLLNREGFSEALDERLDRLITGKIIKPVIVVMPDCFTYYGGSQYLDSEATGRYETHLIQELVPSIDQEYRTFDDPAQRAVMGKSSGGYGSMILGMRHPDVFGVVACHSGDMAFEYCYLPDFPEAMMEIERCGGISGFMKDFYAQPKKKPSGFPALNTIAMASCYSPNLKTKPHLFDLPFDLKSCDLRQEVWERWLEWDPVQMIPRHERALRKLKIFIDCGIRDEFRLYAGSRIFTSKLKKLGIDHVYEEFEDTHMKIIYRYDRSLKFISDAFQSGAS